MKPGRPSRASLSAALLLALAGCDRAPEGQAVEVPVQPKAQAAPKARGGGAAEPEGVTPMAERVATLGVLNKRNGLSRDVQLRPGQAVRVGNAIVRMAACERTPPWEPEQLTGAFVQLDVADVRGQFRRVFSGWLYKESPSLNVVEHNVYDVWPKACTMSFPGVEPLPAADEDEDEDADVSRDIASNRSNAGGAAASAGDASRPKAGVTAAVSRDT